MTEGCIKGCGCGCGSLLTVLVTVCLGISGLIGSQALALGDQPLTNPPAAVRMGITWNQLLADREAAKEESKGWNSFCDLTLTIGLFFGAPEYIIYPIAGSDPKGRQGHWGQMIDPNDWNSGFVPINVPMPEGIFRTYQAFYWNALVTGASGRYGLGGTCRLRPIQPINSGASG